MNNSINLNDKQKVLIDNITEKDIKKDDKPLTEDEKKRLHKLLKGMKI